MAKQKFKITNWPTYNKALRQRGSLTVWLDESAIAAWTDSSSPEGRGRPLYYTDMAVTTVLMIKRVFNLSLRALQGFVDSVFTLMSLPLRCPDYSLVSRRAKTVSISIKTPTRGEISHLVIDSTVHWSSKSGHFFLSHLFITHRRQIPVSGMMPV